MTHVGSQLNDLISVAYDLSEASFQFCVTVTFLPVYEIYLCVCETVNQDVTSLLTHCIHPLQSYQYLQQFLQIAGDESVVFMKRPAPLLGVVTVTDEVAEDHLQTLFVMTHLPLRQRCTQILQIQETSRPHLALLQILHNLSSTDSVLYSV